MSRSLSFRATTNYFLNHGAITSIRFIPETNAVAVATCSGVLIIFEVGSDHPIHEFPTINSPINEISWHSPSRSLYAVTEEGSIWCFVVFDPFSSELAFTDEFTLVSCACSPTENLLLTGSTLGQLRIKNVETKHEVRPYIQAHASSIPTICWHSDGLHFVTGSFDGLVRVWNRSAFQCIASFQPGGPVTFVAYRPNGQMLLVLSGNRIAKLFTIEKPICKRNFTFDSPSGTVLHGGGSLRTAILNECVVIATNGGSVLFFLDSATDPVLVLNAHQSEFRAIDCHGKLPIFATGGGPADQTFKLWTRVVNGEDAGHGTGGVGVKHGRGGKS
jgi:WD40 repeat protein